MEVSQLLGYKTMQFVSLMERGVSKVPHNIIGKLIVILNMPENKIVDSLIMEYANKLIAEIQEGKRSVVKSK